MTITCPKCKTKLNLSDEKVKQEGTRFRCAKCGAVLVYKGKGRKEVPDREEETGAAVQLPPSGEIHAPLEGDETDDRPGKEERPPQVPPLRVAPESPSLGEDAQSMPPNVEESLLTLKKTMAVYGTDKVSSTAGGKRGKGVPGRAVMAGSAAAVLVVLLVAVFIFRSRETAPNKQPAPVPPAGQEAASPLPAQATSPESPPAVTPATPPPAAAPAEEVSSSTPEEKAIEMVKRSDVLLKMTTAEAIVNKWTQDNAGKLKIVGWQAKKIDEQKYLVSYTALDGNTPRGFYFVADLQSGAVEDLAHNPELQKQYNVEYSR